MPPFLYTLLGLLLLLLLHIAPWCSYVAAEDDTLRAGQVIAAIGGGRLVSRNGKFALGFFQPAANITGSKSHEHTTSPWYLGIWFNKIPVFTTVWVANREEPITHSSLNSTQLKISSDGNLVITVNHVDRGTESLVWSTHIVNRTKTTTNTTSVVLLNSGNLALLTNTSSQQMLWQSFDYPTDLTLPGAKFGRDKVTGFTRRVISKKSLIDPGLGPYSVELEATRGIVLKRRINPTVVYWQYASSTSSSLIPILKSLVDLDPQTKGLINPIYVDNEQEEYYMYTSPDESSSSFESLDISGRIKLSVWSEAKQSWETINYQPDDPCITPATCGPFTVCNSNAQPFCDCMVGFSQKSPRDWEFGDRTGGCMRNTPLNCTSVKNMTSSTDMFHPIARVMLPYKPQIMVDATTQRECEQACVSSCSCTAYSYNNSRCFVWHGDLLSANLNDGIDNKAEDVLYLRVAAKDLPAPPILRKNKNYLIVGVVTVASIIGFGLIMWLVVCWRNKLRLCGLPLWKNQDSGCGIMAFRYTDLVHATKNFSEKLGGGGFGSVYKGVLSDSTCIAVKRLDGASQGEKQFRAEVSSIGLIQHINIVKLIGFCCEGDKRLLVYEHIRNGSLDSLLFKKRSGSDVVLNWNTRYQIALGVARGLSYLHQSCRECIIHCDIKPENILVDASFLPKVADFGLAALVGRNCSRVLTTFRGTAGYLAPEWLSGVAITPKIDVYSFGMVLLEVLSGSRNSPETYNTSGSYYVKYFPIQAIDKLHEGDVRSLVDPRLHGDFNLAEAERLCKVAFWCIQDNEFDRPTMGEVVRVLEGLQDTSMPPIPRLLAAMMQECDAPSST